MIFLKKVLIVILSLALGILLCAFMEVNLLDQLFELPDRFVVDEPEYVTGILTALPTGAMLFIVLSISLGAFLASVVSARLLGGNFSWISGGLITLFTLLGTIQITHPTGMAIGMVLGAALGTWIGVKVGKSGSESVSLSSSTHVR